MMKTIYLIINILANALPSLRIFLCTWLIAMELLDIVLLYTAAIAFYAVYIQSIGSGIGIFSELFNDFLLEILTSQLLASSLLPIKPGDDKSSRKLTKEEKAALSLSKELKEILVGLLLGDLHVEKQKTSVNARLKFSQGVIHEYYLLHLYELFQIFCGAVPSLYSSSPDIRTGKVYSALSFKTLSLPCFNELYELFYHDGKKIVPLNIFDLLTPTGLCYWICDDAYWCENGVHLCTESFTLEEINLLVKTLTDKFHLKCTLNKRKDTFRIRISSKSIGELQKLLTPIMPPMMRYKIGL